VKTADGVRMRVLTHGNTIHGRQRLDHVDAEGRHEPLTYYHPSGPIGHVFEQWLRRRPGGQRVGVVGLGTGSLAYYGRPGEDWTFYEIDPAVQRIAEDPRYFNFMSECHVQNRRVLLGDARLTLRDDYNAISGLRMPFDLLVLDAFSSDSIPV